MGLNAPDFPALRDAIRMYAYIQYAAAIIIKSRGDNIKVLAVRDTKELLVDGRPALEVVTYQAEGVYLKMRTSNLILYRVNQSILFYICSWHELCHFIELFGVNGYFLLYLWYYDEDCKRAGKPHDVRRDAVQAGKQGNREVLEWRH